jgi:hypothetical protein
MPRLALNRKDTQSSIFGGNGPYTADWASSLMT